MLIIDDWPLEKAKSNEAHENAELIKPRDRAGSLIPRSQFALSARRTKLGSRAIAAAAFDGLVRKSHVIHIESEESMRKRIG